MRRKRFESVGLMIHGPLRKAWDANQVLDSNVRRTWKVFIDWQTPIQRQRVKQFGNHRDPYSDEYGFIPIFIIGIIVNVIIQILVARWLTEAGK